jgi:DNA gyrase subunit A
MADETNNPKLPLEGGGGPPQNIQPINIEEEMRRSYLDYSMSVIIGRALPDIRDGLKPVHRRILYAMHDMGLLHSRKTVKCAKIVGEVLGKYHPHGDSSVYDATVRMAQDFSLRYPLVDGQGNFGSVDGDPPAAYRYTEARLTAIASEMLADIDKDTVDFAANFDDSTAEPTVLPTRIPTLLINGSNGIAVGMATNIPPHNLTEILTAAIRLVEKPKTTLEDILGVPGSEEKPPIVQGPDFPTAGFIHGRKGLHEAYRTGRGRFLMRAKVAIEHLTKEKDAIIVSEIPYQVNKARLIERIADLVNDKTIEEISDIRDESDRDGMRIVIELKRGSQPEIVLNQLYKHTSMQESFSMIFLAVVNGQPREMGLVQAIQYFIDHRVDVIRRRSAFLLQKAKDRAHILEGYQKALDYLDHVIAIIRASQNRAEARENLVAYFGGKRITINLTGRFPEADAQNPFTAKQADAILELQLHRLTRLSIDEILHELNEQRERIAEYELILGSEKKLRSVIVEELKQIRKDYGDERRTIIQDEAKELQLEDLIADEQVAVTVSHAGYLKRTNVSIYRQQRRGGTGRKGMSTREEDFVEHMIAATTHNYILIFTNTGRVYWLKVYEIPDVSAAGKGKHVGNLVSLQPGETVRAFLCVKDLEEEGKYIFLFHPQRDGEEDSAEGFFQRDVARHYCHWHRQGRRVGVSPGDRRTAVHSAGDAPGDGGALRRRRRALDGTACLRGARHEAGGQGLSCGHGGDAEECNAGRRAQNPQEEPQGRERRTDAEPDPDDFGKRLRQTDSGGRLPVDRTRRQGRHQPEDHGEKRQGGCDSAGERREPGHADQPVRQDHPHGYGYDSRSGTGDPGRQAVAVGGRRPGGRGRGASEGRNERQWQRRRIGAAAGITVL